VKKFKFSLLFILLSFLLLTLFSCNLFRPGDAVFASEVILENTEVIRGEEFTVYVDITNTGGQTATQTISLDFGNNTGVANESVTLSPNETARIELSHIVPDDYDLGEVEITVKSDDDSDSITITVIGEPPFFKIEIKEIQSEIPAGQQLEVLAQITNTGGESGKLI